MNTESMKSLVESCSNPMAAGRFLNEQTPTGVPTTQYRVSRGPNGKYYVMDHSSQPPRVVGTYNSNAEAVKAAQALNNADGMPGSNRAMPKSDEINYSSLDMTAQRKTTPTPMSNMGGMGGGPMP